MITGPWSVPLVVVLSYLLGSISTSIIAGKVFRSIDIRDYGSGNAGATNAFRVLGPTTGIIVIVLDVGKAVIATLLVSRLGDVELMSSESYSLIAGSSAVIGHVWTVFAGFRGGKGVGAAAGMILSLYPLPFLATLTLFLLALFLTGIVSVGSISAAFFFPLLIWLLDSSGTAHYSLLLRIVSIAVGLLILFTHRSNIGRLLRHEENRFPRLMILRSKAARTRAEEAKRRIEEKRNETGSSENEVQ